MSYLQKYREYTFKYFKNIKELVLSEISEYTSVAKNILDMTLEYQDIGVVFYIYLHFYHSNGDDKSVLLIVDYDDYETKGLSTINEIRNLFSILEDENKRVKLEINIKAYKSKQDRDFLYDMNKYLIKRIKKEYPNFRLMEDTFNSIEFMIDQH